MKLSIIVPVYNVENYIDRCLKSIESLLQIDSEVIIVNDGSTDKSEFIILDFIKKHSNVKYIFQRNQGLSAARNRGLELASGEYVWFIDSDDYIDSKQSLELYKYILEHNVDILCFGRYNNYGEKQVQSPKNLKFFNKKSGYEYFKYAINNGTFRTNAWDKIFRKEFLIKNNILFEEGFIYEDMYFCLMSFNAAQTVSVLPIYPYFYTLNNTSSIGHLIRNKDLDVLHFINQSYKLAKNNETGITTTSREFNILIFKWVTNCIMHKYAFMSIFNKNAKDIFNKAVNNDVFMRAMNYCSGHNTGVLNSFSAILLKYFPFLYKISIHLVLIIRRK